VRRTPTTRPPTDRTVGDAGRAAAGTTLACLDRVHTARTQGVFYLVTGLWPIVHYRSFAAVTGDKTDVWLVKTVGALITAVGATLLAGASRPEARATLRTLGVTSALALGLADLVYVARGTIPRVYLGDALAEAGLVAAWTVDPT
jgi:hypothetical protein